MSSLEVALSQLTAEECVVTLAKVLDNILTEESYQKKTRKFKLSNETFSRRVARHPGGLDVLMACHFSKTGQALQLKKENENKMLIWNARQALQERAEYLGFQISTMPVPPMPSSSTSDAATTDRFDATSIYEASTVATIDDLDLETSKDTEHSHSFKSLDPSQSPVSPLATPQDTTLHTTLHTTLDATQDATQDETLQLHPVNDPFWNTLQIPQMPQSKTATPPTKPPLAPRSSSKFCSEKVQSPCVQNGANHERDDKSITNGIDNQPSHLQLFESTPPMYKYQESNKEDMDCLKQESARTSSHDPLLMEMEQELNDCGWADDEAYLDELDGRPTTSDLAISEVLCPNGDDEVMRALANIETTSVQPLPIISRMSPEASNDNEDDMSDARNKNVWAKDNYLLQTIEDELFNALEPPSAAATDADTNIGVALERNPQPDITVVGTEHILNPGSPSNFNAKVNLMPLMAESPPISSKLDHPYDIASFPSPIAFDVGPFDRELMGSPESHTLNMSQVIDRTNSPQEGNPHNSQNGLSDFFKKCELPTNDSDDELPWRSKQSKSQSVDDLEKEMTSLLAKCSEVSTYAEMNIVGAGDNVHELDTDGESVVSNRLGRDDKQAADDRSIPEQIQEVRYRELARGLPDDLNYSSEQAHSDWLKLNGVMQRNSLQAEYEACWGSICTLSVVCADLSTFEMGLPPPTNGRGKKLRKNRSKRSWLPLEIVRGLWSLVLSSDEFSDSVRVAYVCSKMYDILVDSQYIEVHGRDENENMPHATWVRVRKEKMVLLGFALPISISHQAEWMRKLAVAIVGDDQFWYGRYALPTIAVAGGDDEANAKTLLRDMDFVQSRLDVLGIVSGTRRHVQDALHYIQVKKKRFNDRQRLREEGGVEIDDDAGIDVALDACHVVATYLYRQGQVLSKSNASATQMIELADALRLIGTAVGEWGDVDLEMQLYKKIMKVLHDCGGYSSECSADTLLCMGHCSLGKGDFGTALSCYEEALEMYRYILGSNSYKVAEALHHNGVIYCERGELDAAMETFKTSLKIKQSIAKNDDYDQKTADTLCWIGKVYRERDLPEKAKKYFSTARDVKEELCGTDSIEVAEILHNIAVLYDDGNDFERSLHYYRKSLKIRRAALGDLHEDVCDTISCIGNVYKSMGVTATALKVFRRANYLRTSAAKGSPLNAPQTLTLIRSYEDVLDILRNQVKASQNPEIETDEISSILLKMGQLYDTINIFEKCEKCFDKSLALRMSLPDVSKAGQVFNVMGISFAKRRKFNQAMSAFDQALALRKKCLGDGHIDVAETLHNMGNCAAKACDLNEAKAFYDEALRIKRMQFGDCDASIAQTLHNIGNVLAAQGSNDKAMQTYSEALSLRRNLLGDDSVEVAYTLHCIAKINRKQHDLDAAQENFNSSLRIKRLRLPQNHQSIAETLEQLGSLYMDTGDEEEGAKCLNLALNIYKSKHGDGLKIAQMYEQLGSKCERKKSAARALVYFKRALRVRARVLGDEHESVADMHYRIGKVQRGQHLYHDALASFQAATKVRKKSVGRNDLLVSDIVADAGLLQIQLGQVDIADKCFNEALRIRSFVLDPRHEKIGECMLLSGKVLFEKKRYPEAISMFQDALGIFQDNAGDFGLLCADAYHQLGKSYLLSSDYDKAQTNLEKCLKSYKANRGDNDLHLASVNHSLGEVFFARGDYHRAEDYFRESVEFLVAQLGDNHVDVANAVLSLGRTCNKLNSPDEATMYFEQARITKQNHLGDNHLEVLDIDVEIARCHVVKKEFSEALQGFQSYVRARRAEVGDDEILCQIQMEIGITEYELRRYDSALSSLALALMLQRALFAEDHQAIANTLYHLGVVYDAKHAYPESMKYHKEAFRLRRRLLGPDDLSVAQSLDKMSNLYMCQPNLEKASQSMKEVLRIRTLKLGKDHIDVATSMFGMGVILSESNDLEKAMECYNMSLRIRRHALGDASVEVAQTLHNMGTVFGKRQDFESALDHWRRALGSYREAGLSDEDHLVAVTIGNMNMAEAYLGDSQ